MENTLENRASFLRRGQPVFLIGYHDREMRLPFVEPYVYIETTQPNEGAAHWYFQKAESFVRDPLNSASTCVGRDDVLEVGRDGLASLVDWPGLVAELTDGLDAHDQTR